MNVGIGLVRAEIFKVIVNDGNRIAAVQDQEGGAGGARWHARRGVFGEAPNIIFVKLRIVPGVYQSCRAPGRVPHYVVHRGRAEDKVELLGIFYNLIKQGPDLHHGLGSSKGEVDEV